MYFCARWACWVVVLVLAAGCQPPATAPKPEEVRLDFPNVVQQLVGLHATVAQAFTDNKPDDAHDALHEIPGLLDQLPKLAEEAGIRGDALVTVQDAAKSMFDILGGFDDAMHEDKPVEFEPHKESLERAMTQLKDVALAAAK